MANFNHQEIKKERREINDAISHADREFKASVRWLFEAERFKNLYESDSWKNENSLAGIAIKTHKEAVAKVEALRANLDSLYDKLEELDKRIED